MSIVRKSAQTLGAHLLVFVQGLVLTPVVIKVAGTETYGGYVLIVTYLGIIVGISSLGVGISAKRWLPSCETRAGRAELFFPQFTFQLAMILGLAVISMTAYELGHKTGTFNLPGFSGWLIPGYLVTYVLWVQPTEYFRYTHRVGIYNVSTVIHPYLFISLSLLIYFGMGILNPGTLILSSTMAFLLVAMPQLWKLRGEIGLAFCLPSTTKLRTEIRLGAPIMLSYVVDVILAGGDRYIIAAIMSVRDVGIYAPAYALGSLIVVLPKVFGVVLPQFLSQRVDSGDTAGAQRLMSRANRIFLLASIPYVVGALVLGEQVLRLYANEEIATAAWLVVPLVALGSIVYGLILINANLLFVRLRTVSLFRINAVAAVLNIFLNIVLLQVFADVVMAAVATLLSYLISYAWLARQLSSDKVAARIDIGWLLRTVAASILMGWAVYASANALPQQGAVSTGIGVLTGCIVYTLALFILRVAEDEFRLVWKWAA